MDPLSIAASATGLATACVKLSKVLYIWVDETRSVDTNVSGFGDEILSLSRVLDAVGKSIKENPVINAPGSDGNRELWSNLKITLDDCRTTLNKLNEILAEVQSAAPFGLSMLRRPVKQIKLSLKMKDIEVYRQRIQHFNGAMQLPLQMINVSVTLQNRAGQERTEMEIAGLCEQVGRVEKGLRLRHDPHLTADDQIRNENDRCFQNLMRLVRQADTFSAKASSIAGTIYGGSILGDPLSRDQWASIENWIPPPVIEEPPLEIQRENRPPTATASSSTAVSHAALRSPGSFTTEVTTLESDSDYDSEIEREMTKKFIELALGSFRQQKLDKAEKQIGKVINRLSKAARNGHPLDPELRVFQIRLAVVHCLQGRWKEAEKWLLPFTADKKVDNIEGFHGMHALALQALRELNYTLAVRHCKRAISGKRRILGKDHISLGESISLLALIFERAGDATEAEAYQCFLQDSFPDLHLEYEDEPSRYIEKSFDLDKIAIEKKREEDDLTETSHKYLSTEIQEKNTHDETLPHVKVADVVESQKEKSLPLQKTEQIPNTVQFYTTSSVAKPPDSSRRPHPEISSSYKSDTFFIGIDLGIVYTKVAFGFINDTKVHVDSGLNWSEHDNSIPTVLYYDQSSNIVGWGLDIVGALTQTGYPKEGVQKCEWFTLLPMASRDASAGEISLLPPLRGKPAIDLMTDFLSRLQQLIFDRLPTLGKARYSLESSISWIITVPALYDDGGRAELRAAAIAASYLRNDRRDCLSFVSRPRAALLSFVGLGALSLQKAAVILIVHCGPGIVELCSYQMSKDDSSFEEYTMLSRDSCGFSVVNRNFSSILRSRIKKMTLPSRSRTAGKVYALSMRDFNQRIRTAFNGDGGSWVIDVKIEADFPDAGIEDGRMSFTREEILVCFDPVITRICELLDEQADRIAFEGGLGAINELKDIVLCGDFSQSDYLFRLIKDHASRKFIRAQVIRAPGSEISLTAAKGAVLSGMAASMSMTGTDINPPSKWL